jgi:bifunctional non-homologous end joining protein LigD
VADRLDDYRGKRDLDATPEPAGAVGDAAAGDAPRFVIQEHSATRLHWDLRLEHDGALASWALPRGLPWAPGDNRMAVRTEDHPLEYLTFAGEIPAGQYGAGTMTVWDHGTYEVLKFAADKVEVHLHGERVDARYALFPLKKTGDEWMIHRMDPPADPDREPLPERVLPMLATAAKLPEGAGWAYEVKWDGVRVIAASVPGTLRLSSRSAGDVTARYPELVRGARRLGMHEAVLDGEVVALGPDGRPSFSLLQRRMHLTREAAVKRLAAEAPVTYVVFDLLWLDGHDLTRLPYDERRARLRTLDLGSERWLVPEPLDGTGAAVLAATREQGLEGVVAKRRDAPYEPGRRSSSWVKVRNRRTVEITIGGWMPGEGRRESRIGSLLAGVHDEAGAPLRFAGRVGTGFSERELERLAALLGPERIDEDPFVEGADRPAGAVFCAPRYRAEVAFSEWTPDGLMRQPSYLGLREDEEAGLVVGPPTTSGRRTVSRVHVGEHDVDLANPDKVLWPDAGTTKRALLEYVVAVAPVLLPHLEDRALTLRRWPNGVAGKGFFEKHRPAGTPEWVRTETIVSERSGSIEYVVVDGVATLAWLANLAAIELHVPLARVSAPDTPTAMVFDLDPGAPATIVECCRVALLIEGMLGGVGLEAHAKTSGSKGLQVYVPLNDPAVTFEDTKRVSLAVAQTLSDAQPELVVARQTKSARTGRVLIDWSQNDPHKTTVAVYSPRARDRPTVSTPVTWDEVRTCADSGEPLAFEPAAVLERVARDGDLFGAVLSRTQTLPG